MRPLLLMMALLAPGALAAQAPPSTALHASPLPGIIQTHAERTAWSELTPPEGVRNFYRALARRSPEVRLRRIGTSHEGRDLLLVTIARPAVSGPREARASGKPIVLIGAQVHGDEPAGKEGLMLFARDLAEGALNHLLDDVVFVFVPQLNPDGAAVGAWGSRTNPAGFNLNRDYLRLEHPETRAMVEDAIVEWTPHVIVDAHELSGPPPVYDFYTLGPDNINGPSETARFTKERVIPAIVDAVEEEGYTHFVYHVLPNDPAQGLSGGSYGARALTSYGGAHGAISILYETLRAGDARVDVERRAAIHRLAMEALGSFVAEHRREVVSVVDEGRREMVERGARPHPADSIAVRYDIVPSRTVRYTVRSGRRSGGSRAADAVLELRVPLLDSAVVTLSRTRPAAYAIAAHREDLAHHLVRHGIRVERTGEPLVLDVERFEVDSIRAAGAEYEGYVPQQFWTTVRPATISLPAGSYLVRTGQVASALLFHLLEPEDENSYASVGAFAADAIHGRTLPVYRLPALPPCRCAVLRIQDSVLPSRAGLPASFP